MPKRVLQGVVVSDKQNKTVVVKVERRFTHPLLKKTVRRDQELPRPRRGATPKVGDQVWIEESKPISKLKALDCARQRPSALGRKQRSVFPQGADWTAGEGAIEPRQS
jgi:small subunit ribosomal protein S17